MTESATASAGPNQLGRILIVRPGATVPHPWAHCQRIRVAPHNCDAETKKLLRQSWQTRKRLVVELDGELGDAEPITQAKWWQLKPGHTMAAEVLSHLLLSNAVDARDPRRVQFAPLTKALSLGARVCDDLSLGDVMGDDGPLWCDGGPLHTGGVRFAGFAGEANDNIGKTGGNSDQADGNSGGMYGNFGKSNNEALAPVIPAVNLAVGSLAALRRATPNADLAPDQHTAVAHLGGPACILAPAGSGKTRVLTERARYLVRDLGVAPKAVCLVAFNVRARKEMQERTSDIDGLKVRTLNSLALAICNGTKPFARPTHHKKVEVIDERAVRARLGKLVKPRRKAMTDQLAPWIEALSASRLGLRNPNDIEFEFTPDVPEFSRIAPEYVEGLAADDVVDFDEQIIRAINILLTDPKARAAARKACGVMLVDEFQDLTPAHLLFIRLLAGPRADVFGVGDDDQTIYGYSGASPRWLIDFQRYFPGASRYHLHINYRCPPHVISAASNLLSHNEVRVDKEISAPSHKTADADESVISVQQGPDAVAVLRATLTTMISNGTEAGDIAVLTRVNSTLLAPQLLLEDMGLAADRPIGRSFLSRTGVAGALAWLTLAVAPSKSLPRQALSNAARRPQRGLSPRVVEWLGEKGNLAAVRGLASRIKDEKTGEKVNKYADDVEMLRRQTLEANLTTYEILEIVRKGLGLGKSLDDRLDASRRSLNKSSHGDDLRALDSVAKMNPNPHDFIEWLTDRLPEKGDYEESGFGNGFGNDGLKVADKSRVRLATVHKVKGLEWPHVIVYEASQGLMPHRLARDIEEERRIFHVALTRCSKSVTVISQHRPSDFVAELYSPAVPHQRWSRGSRGPTATTNAEGAGDGVTKSENASGVEGDNEMKMENEGMLGSDQSLTLDGFDLPQTERPDTPQPPTDPQGAALFAALRAWRKERSEEDGVPAYVIFHDGTLIEIANRRPQTPMELLALPGIGQNRLNRYGDDLLKLLNDS